MESSNILLILFGAWAVVSGAIYGFINFFKYGQEFYNEAKAYPDAAYSDKKLLNITVFVVLLGIIYGIMGSIAAMTGVEMTGKKWVELTIPVAIIGAIAIGSTMILINVLPVMMRTFENTIGFLVIGGGELNEILKDIIDTSKNNVVDYTVLATQLYVENFKAYLGSMLPNIENGASISRFTNVFVKNNIFNNGNLVYEDQQTNEKTSVGKLLDKVIQKRVLSETTWISLGALFTMFGSYYYTA